MRWLLGNPTNLASTAFIGPHCPPLPCWAPALPFFCPEYSSPPSQLVQTPVRTPFPASIIASSETAAWETSPPLPNKGTPNPAILMNFSSWFHSTNHLIAYYTIYFFFMFMAYFYLLLQNYKSMIICFFYWLNSRDIEECLVLVGDRYWFIP